MEQINQYLEQRQNVSVDSILGWDIDGEHYSYLDFYDEESLLNSTAELKQKGLVNEAVAYERQNIARNLIGLLDDEVIAEKTGLSLKEIKVCKQIIKKWDVLRQKIKLINEFLQLLNL